ncbi:MAG: helix-turn-helix transcriptional regulator [Longimicrobiales bacterium]
MSAIEAEDPRYISLVLAAIFLLVVVAGVIDLILDRPTDLLGPHVVLELTIVVASLAGATYLALGWLEDRKRLTAVSLESKQRDQERREWERRASELLAGLGTEISSQLGRWHLTPAEKRVALMLLKGHSHKRIARQTATSERTARQHSVAIYRKAGVAGRAELAGFFLAGLTASQGVDDIG